MTKQEYMDIYNVIGAAMEVHSVLGHGMAEPIYQEALVIEMKKRGMQVEREKELRLHYKDMLLEKTYYADLYYDGVIIELKSVDEIIPTHRSQLFNYMRITKTLRGILINFGEESLYSECYLYLPEKNNFVMLNQDNYMNYVNN